MTVDPRAATGFGSRVDAYERGRPEYPAAAVSRLAAEFALTPESTVLDLAAGTGKLTRSLIRLAGRVIAVDPSPAMRSALTHQVPSVEVRDGTAEAIPLSADSVDAVFVGQAFHWFRVREAFQEIARVLRPGGGLRLLWNRERWSEAGLAWLGDFNALVEPHKRAAGSFPAADEWRGALERIRAFTPWQAAEFTQVHRIGVEDFVALVGSWSWIANLPDRQRAELLDQVRAPARSEDAVLSLPYATEVYWTRLEL